MAEERVGEVMKYFSKPSVAAVKITDGSLSVGDQVRFMGHTTDFEDTIASMEVNNAQIETAKVGDYIGVRVAGRVRPGDEVIKILPE